MCHLPLGQNGSTKKETTVLIRHSARMRKGTRSATPSEARTPSSIKNAAHGFTKAIDIRSWSSSELIGEPRPDGKDALESRELPLATNPRPFLCTGLFDCGRAQVSFHLG